MLIILFVAQIVCLAVLVVRLLPGRRRRPPVAPITGSASAGEISIVVVTLNEAHRVAPCLSGVMAQGPAVREIIVVDSGSTDGTQDLVEAAARHDSRVRLLRDDPLPDAWVGKVWALQHGLTHATSDWVLGIDADTIPQPGMAAGALAAAKANRFDAVSFAPRFRVDTAAERWLQPALLVTLIYRFGAAGTDTGSERVMANGQCFLARRSTLLSVGGYSSARSSFSDDVTLARHIARRGYRVGFLDGSRLYDVLSYTSARETWREWGRSLDLKDSTSAVRQWMDVLFLLVAQGTPVPALLVLGWFWASPAVQPVLAASAVFLGIRIMLQFALVGSYARRGVAFWLSPLADPLAAVRILLSSVKRPKAWRGRTYASLLPLEPQPDPTQN